MIKVKFCGLSRICDIEGANALMPEYIGFVFAPQSRRCILPEKAAKLKSLLSPGIKAVGVFVNQQPEFAAELLKPFKVAVEFRNQTWFQDNYKEDTLEFLHSGNVIHSICDEPQAGIGSVPFVNRVTDDTAFIRLHGRNVHGWTQQNRTSEEWRDVRYLYDYNRQELEWLQKQVNILQHKTKDIYIVFNNNSGGHAAKNAKEFISMLNIEYSGLAPKQLKLF